MKLRIVSLLITFLEILARIELPEVNQVRLKVNQRNLAEKQIRSHVKEETLLLKCKKKGNSINCSPASKSEKKKNLIKRKNVMDSKTPFTHAKSARTQKKSKDIKNHVKFARIEAKLKARDKEVANILHDAIHEVHAHIPSINEIVTLVDKVIEEEYQKHSKNILNDKTDGKGTLRKFSSEVKTKKKKTLLDKSKKIKHVNKSKLEKTKIVPEKISLNLTDPKPSKQVGTSDVLLLSSKNASDSSTEEKYPYIPGLKLPLDKVRERLQTKKLKYFSERNVSTIKLATNINKIIEQNETNQNIYLKPNYESNVDLNYIMNRLASKRKEFLERVLCSVTVPIQQERTFDQVVDVPWLDVPSRKKISKEEIKQGRLFDHHEKTPSLNYIPTKVNHELLDKSSGDDEDDEDEFSPTKYTSTATNSSYKTELYSLSPSMTGYMLLSSAISDSDFDFRILGSNKKINVRRVEKTELPSALIGASSFFKTSFVSLAPTSSYRGWEESSDGYMTLNIRSQTVESFDTNDNHTLIINKMEKPNTYDSLEDSRAVITPTTYSPFSLFPKTSKPVKLVYPSSTAASESIMLLNSFSLNSNYSPNIMDEIILAETLGEKHADTFSQPRELMTPSLFHYSQSLNSVLATKYIGKSAEYAGLNLTRILGKNFLVRLNMMRLFNTSLLYPKNDQYKRLKRQLELSIASLYDVDESFHSNKVVSISRFDKDNTTLVDIEIYFKDRSSDHLSRLQWELKSKKRLANQSAAEDIIETSLLNDRITDIQWCLPPCYNPYHCFPICDDTCCSSPPNAFESTKSYKIDQLVKPVPVPINNQAVPAIVYNYIVTTPEQLTNHVRELFQSKPHEINAFTSQVDAQTGNILCGPYCSAYYCLPACLPDCCRRK